jgi:acyl-CoA synthetase (AMP-forming)/AMP-acid ligase II
LTESYWPASDAALHASTIAGILRDAAARAPDRVALVAGTADPSRRARRTYAEVLGEAEAAARAMAARFEPGERLAVLAPSTAESFLLTFAAAMARLVLVPINPLSRPREIEHILRRSQAAGVVFAAEHRGNDLAASVGGVCRSLPGLRELIPLQRWTELVSGGRARDAPLPPPQPDDVAQLVFTSGTTGAPKGVMLTHLGMTNAARCSGERFGIAEGDVYVGTIPLYHVGGQAVTFMVMQALATHVLVEQYDAALHLELLETEKATHTVGVPTMFHDLMAHPSFAQRDLSALRAVTCGGSTVPVELIRELERGLGAELGIIFGQTETCGYISQTHPDDDPAEKSLTVGPPFPPLEARVVDASSGAVVSFGEVGELQVRGAWVMAGYVDDPEQTAAALEPDGWLHTGDLVAMNERGYLTIAGRLKEMIVTGGINVYPSEVEAVLGEHPAVVQATVLGMPDPRWGEAVVAVVRCAGDGADSADVTQLQAFCRERLAPYKVPKHWHFTDALPMTSSGKVQKHLLLQRLLADAQ